MIYLIDDNKDDKRVKEMGLGFVDDGTFKQFLKPISHLKKVDDLESIEGLSFLSDAKCILVHKTTDDCDDNFNFIKDSTTNAEKIIDKISNYGVNIPLIIFSNRMSENAGYNYDENPNCIFQIKKNTFYNRLYDFLIHYQNTQKIELRIIAFGKNYKAVEISRYSKILIEGVAQNPPNTLLDLRFIRLSVLRVFHELANIQQSFDDFVNELEDNPITVFKFIENISIIIESINEYGENIYNWQK